MIHKSKIKLYLFHEKENLYSKIWKIIHTFVNFLRHEVYLIPDFYFISSVNF